MVKSVAADASLLYRQAPVAAISDENGHALVHTDLGVASVTVSADGYERGVKRVRVLRSAVNNVVVRMLPAVRVSGRVVDDAGKPVANADVFVSDAAGPFLRAIPEVTTDDAGSFEIDDLGPGEFRMSAAAPGYASPTPARVVLEAGESLNIRLSVSDAGQVQGIVSLETHEPVGDAVIRLEGPRGQFLATTNDDGFYEVTVPPGSFRWSVMSTVGVPKLFEGPLTLGVGDTQHDITLEPGRRVAGTVVGCDHRVAIRTETDLTKAGPLRLKDAAMNGSKIATTDESGQFSIDGIAPGRLTVVAEDPACGSGSAEVEVTAAGDERVEIELDTGGAIFATVSDFDGGPVAGLTGELHPVGRADTQVSLAVRERGVLGPMPVAEGGRLTWRGVQPGEYEIRLHDGRGPIPMTMISGDTRVSKYEGVDSHPAIDIDLSTLDLEGIVVDGAGQPVGGALVRLEGSNAAKVTVADDVGEFVFEGTRAAEVYHLVANSDGVGVGTASGQPDDWVEIELSPVATLELAVPGQGKLRVRGPRSITRLIEASGVVAMDVPVGRYMISFEGEQGYTDVELKLESSGGVAKLSPTPWVSVSGRLAADNGSDTSGWAVLAVDGRHDASKAKEFLAGAMPRTNSSGEFEVDHLRRGKMTVVFVAPDGRRTHDVAVDASEGSVEIGDISLAGD